MLGFLQVLFWITLGILVVAGVFSIVIKHRSGK